MVALGARSHAGALVSSVHPHLGDGDHSFETSEAAASTDADICFSCMPSGSLAPLLPTIAAPIVVDLSDEHRGEPEWTYGLAEHARGALANSKRVANPGCYPTAMLLGLIPFVRAHLVEGPVIVDALSGVSGAGKGLDEALSFTALHGSATSYGPVPHRHVAEMERELGRFDGGEIKVSFTPHLVPMARGVLVTARAGSIGVKDDTHALSVLRDAYAGEEFVSVIEEWPTTKAVLGTNRAIMSARVDRRAGFLIVSVAIDNLGKGAAGQAIQNANIALGLDETSGLDRLGVWP